MSTWQKRLILFVKYGSTCFNIALLVTTKIENIVLPNHSYKILHKKIQKVLIQVLHDQSNDCGWGVYCEKAQIDSSSKPEDYPRFQFNL